MIKSAEIFINFINGHPSLQEGSHNFDMKYPAFQFFPLGNFCHHICIILLPSSSHVLPVDAMSLFLRDTSDFL